MANQPATPGAVPGPEQPPAPLPKGVVLGKDGKPCRSCTSKSAFSAWASQMGHAKPAPSSRPFSSAATTSTPASEAPARKDCPADVETLGRSTWTLLHTIAATYPPKPTPVEQNNIRDFFRLFSKLYPCWVCAEDFQAYMKKEAIKTESRDAFGNWLCDAHNEVNRKLGKPIFDCSKWEERWRTGWKDGSCD
ncbi:augmenter of liver regeneration [Diplogelasinospora grovesii]|uniref:Sulfhydryl oxidase n=1 Tax=Diplogelasinospora grovesii TaxID=303347 RepID=A0AAN6N0Q9_9PEZI|nr:augmenter of liver regeneration [Diplogelasinospora grovesii]